MTFEQWWAEDGRFYDPDTEDVPWFDKRKGLAELAFVAGESGVSKDALAEISKQMRERASFGSTASFNRLLETWADVLDGKPDVGWAPRNRQDLERERENLDASRTRWEELW